MADEHADSRDERIGRVLNEYLDRKQRGDENCEAELLEAYPDLADELRAHFGMVSRVSSVTDDEPRDEERVTALPDDALPGYEILGEIHRGGQGVVYEAIQKATRRKVAIKVMREGPFGGWRDRARFEREVQALGALNHPNIVTIHDSGVAAGCHFFVMDYIVGLPLNMWLSSRPRPIQQILRLFVTICDAIHAAHTKGIIHRDLKPGNIRIDDEGRAHILDFGLAKVAAHDEDDKADMTAIGQFVGSLPWTSPEQAQGMLDDVDTRTDVYAIGVILYQALTRSFPYEVVGPMRDVLNRIVGDEPVRPRTLRKEIDQDVEAIVLKCLRKEPPRRYQTAGELGRDIERYLNGEPIVARSDSGLYVLGKMVRRYRVPVAVAAAFAVLIGISLLASLSLWRQAVNEKNRAIAAHAQMERERNRADSKANEAAQAQAIAEREQARAEAQAEQLRRTTYLNQIALARNAYEQQYLTRAEQLLQACPPDLRQWEWHYLSRLCRQSALLDVRADDACVVAMAIRPDGERIFTGGCDGLIKAWDATTGRAITQFKGHSDRINTLACSPDGRWIASGSRDTTLRLWDSRTGMQRVLQEGEQSIQCVCFSPTGACLVSGGENRRLTFWDVAHGRIIRTSPVQEKDISCLAYSPDGKWVVSGELLNPSVGNCKTRLWDATTGQSVRELMEQPGAVLSVAFSPDGRYIASGSGVSPTNGDMEGTLRIFDNAGGKQVLTLRGHEGFVDAVAFSPDGKRLASAGVPRTQAFGMESDRTLKIWDVTTGAELHTYSAHRQGGRSVVWSPDGQRIFSAGMDGRLKAWSTETLAEARILRGHSGPVHRIVYSPDGTQIASCGAQGEDHDVQRASSDNTVRIWDLETGSQNLLLTDNRNAVLGLAWSPNGRYIASGSADQTVRAWDSLGGTRRLLVTNQGGPVQCVTFSPDSTLLGTVAGHEATLWNMPDGTEYNRLWHRENPKSITFSPDGRWVATGSESGEVRIWDYRNGSACREISTGPGFNGAWFSPDSNTIATAHAHGGILLWNVSTGNRISTMRSSERAVEWLDFSPNGQRIASCTEDSMLRIWDVSSASEVYSIHAHHAPVMCVRFNPDGSWIATCGQDHLVKLWGTDLNRPSGATSAPAGG